MLFTKIFIIGFGLLSTFSMFAAGNEESNRLRFVVSGEPDTLDPQETTGTLTFQITRSLYDTLLEPDAAGNLLPALATEWQFSEDKLSIEFNLRDDVYFHHGTRLTAKDVAGSIMRIVEKGDNSPHALDFNYIAGVEVLSDFRLRVNLKQVYVPILTVLASGWAAILPNDLIQAGHNFSAEPVGTGPFMFREWQSRQRISLDANPSYHEKGAPILDGLDFVFITDPVLQVQAIERGDVDGIDIVVNPELSVLRENKEIKIQTEPTGLVLVIAMNTQHEVLRNRATRKAIAAVIDTDEALKQAYGGGVVIETFMDRYNPFYPDAITSDAYSRDQAIGILSQYKNAEPLRIIAPQNFDAHVRAAQLYHDMLSKAGFPVTLEFYEWSRWLDSVYRGKDFEFTVIGHTGKLDPDVRLSMFGTDKNYVQWGESAIEEQLQSARVEPDFDIRKSYYAAVLNKMAAEQPFVYVGTPNRYIALKKNVHNFFFQPQLETYDFRQTYKQ